MHAVIEKNRLKISVAEFYNMAWYEKNDFISKKQEYGFEYGYLEIDVHKSDQIKNQELPDRA